MGGGGGYSGGSGGNQGQQPKVAPQPKPVVPGLEPTVTQSTKSDTNVPTNGTDGIGGGAQQGGAPPEETDDLLELDLPELEVPEQRDRCLIVPFKTTLLAPDAHAISSTAIGQILRVASRGHRVEIINNLNEVCGVVAFKATRIMECAKQGVKYEAEVLFKDGAELQVRISNAPIF